MHVGILFSSGILVGFEPREPYPGYVTLGGTLPGVTIALLITTVIAPDSSVAQCVGWGAAMGLLVATQVFLAKGGWASGAAPYVVPTGILTGAVLGLANRWLARRAT